MPAIRSRESRGPARADKHRDASPAAPASTGHPSDEGHQHRLSGLAKKSRRSRRRTPRTCRVNAAAHRSASADTEELAVLIHAGGEVEHEHVLQTTTSPSMPSTSVTWVTGGCRHASAGSGRSGRPPRRSARGSRAAEGPCRPSAQASRDERCSRAGVGVQACRSSRRGRCSWPATCRAPRRCGTRRPRCGRVACAASCGPGRGS